MYLGSHPDMHIVQICILFECAPECSFYRHRENVVRAQSSDGVCTGLFVRALFLGGKQTWCLIFLIFLIFFILPQYYQFRLSKLHDHEASPIRVLHYPTSSRPPKKGRREEKERGRRGGDRAAALDGIKLTMPPLDRSAIITNPAKAVLSTSSPLTSTLSFSNSSNFESESLVGAESQPDLSWLRSALLCSSLGVVTPPPTSKGSHQRPPCISIILRCLSLSFATSLVDCLRLLSRGSSMKLEL